MMRVAVVSDIHGNRTAFDAVMADLRQTAPDLIFHGGDLVHGGADSAGIVDRIRDLGWRGVAGNADEMLFDPDSLTQFAQQSPQLTRLFKAIEEMAAADREALGEQRLDWLRSLPRSQTHGRMTLVHASPETAWRAPGPEAADGELAKVYSPLGGSIAVYAHIHRAFIRSVARVDLPAMTVVNTGSVSLCYDGDRRASYLLLDGETPSIRRVEYDLDRELKALAASGLPHVNWVAKMLETASPQMP